MQQVTKESVEATRVDFRVHESSAAISEANAFTAADVIRENPANGVFGTSGLVYHLVKLFNFEFEHIKRLTIFFVVDY